MAPLTKLDFLVDMTTVNNNTFDSAAISSQSSAVRSQTLYITDKLGLLEWRFDEYCQSGEYKCVYLYKFDHCDGGQAAVALTIKATEISSGSTRHNLEVLY
jgi:hypothetical protein